MFTCLLTTPSLTDTTAKKKKPKRRILDTWFGLQVCFFFIHPSIEHTYDYLYVCSTDIFFSFVGSLNALPPATSHLQPHPGHLPPPITRPTTTSHHQPLPQTPKKAQTTRLDASFGLQVRFFTSPTTPNTCTIICTCVWLIFFFLWVQPTTTCHRTFDLTPGGAAMTKTGPNDASGVVWAIGEFFLIFFRVFCILTDSFWLI